MSTSIPPPAPAWIADLAQTLQQSVTAEYQTADAMALLAIEVRDRGPAMFWELGTGARTAAGMLRLRYDNGPNWFRIQNTGFPFRMVQCILAPREYGIYVIYTQNSGLKLNQQPNVSRDFVSLALQPPDHYLIFVHSGQPVSGEELLQRIFREGFSPKAAEDPKSTASQIKMLQTQMKALTTKRS
jgi:hypothetical protein